MSIPANIQADLAGLDAAITGQQVASAAAASAADALATAQSNLTQAQAQATAAAATTATAATQLQTDIAAWVASGANPPAGGPAAASSFLAQHRVPSR